MLKNISIAMAALLLSTSFAMPVFACTGNHHMKNCHCNQKCHCTPGKLCHCAKPKA